MKGGGEEVRGEIRKIRVRHISLNSALGKQKPVDLYEFEANLVYISEFQASQESYIERPQLKKLGKKSKEKKKQCLGKERGE